MQIVCSPGKKDGLIGRAPRARSRARSAISSLKLRLAEGEEPSPFGNLVAQASAQGYKIGQTPIPYHGYFYRILKRQGAGAAGGAYDYLVKGKMIGGFALVASPRNTAIPAL